MPFTECDFCDRVLDEDEHLTPVFIGERPAPRTLVARGTAPKLRKVGGYRHEPGGDVVVAGRPMDELTALVTALETSSEFDIEAKPAVEEIFTLGEEAPRALADDPAPMPVKGEVDTAKVGVTITATPEPPAETPALEVCPHCETALTEEGN